MDINLSTENYQINGQVNSDGTTLIMQVPETGHVTTKSLPQTESILAKYLPSIFKCKCFNEANNDFKQECKNTELGHLFEHIMLEHLCMEKIANGQEEATYEGRTNWNWEKDPVGTFNINITAGLADLRNIEKAFKKSAGLLAKIIA